MDEATQHFTIARRDGTFIEVPCYPSDAPGLVIHQILLDDDALAPLWTISHESTGFALVGDHPFVARGEAEIAARHLAAVADWTQTPDPDLRDHVLTAVMDATLWRDGESHAYVNLAGAIGDDVIRDELAPTGCGGSWHRVSFGWGQTYVRQGTRRTGNGKGTVLRLSPDATEESARTVWDYEPRPFTCIDCGAEL